MSVSDDDNIEGNEALLGPIASTIGTSKVGFEDITGVHPLFKYWYAPSVNLATYGGQTNELSPGGSSSGASADVGTPVDSIYPHNNVKQTSSGHVLELNDTVGSERVLLKHRSGSGVDLRPDGTILISSQDRLIMTVSADQTIVIEGDANLQYKGNVNMTVNGDYNLDVGGNFNVSADGNLFTTVDGQMKTQVSGAVANTIKGNETKTVLGTSTESTFGNKNYLVKGAYKITSQNNFSLVGGAGVNIAGYTTMNIASPKTTMTTETINLLASTGTIGGEGVMHYGHNFFGISAKFSEGVNAPTFHGDLDGLADEAVTSGVTRSQSYGDFHGDVGSNPGWSINNVATNGEFTAKATQDLVNGILFESNKGVKEVSIDPGDILANLLKRREHTGGVTDRDLRPTEVRSKLRDEANLANAKFVQSQVQAGTLSANYANASPPAIGRTAQGSNRTMRGQDKLGNGSYSPNIGRFEAKVPGGSFTPEAAYVITSSQKITAATKLAQGVSVGKFLGGEGDRGSLNHIPDQEKRRKLARNLQPNAEAFKTISKNQGKFVDHRLKVAEGIYVPGPLEVVTPSSINDLAAQGRVVVYELVDNNGNIDNDLTFDLANWWKNMIMFEKLILDYDTYDPTGELNAQIILVMPEMDSTYSATFSNSVETRYNGAVQSSGELIEILARPTAQSPAPSTSAAASTSAAGGAAASTGAAAADDAGVEDVVVQGNYSRSGTFIGGFNFGPNYEGKYAEFDLIAAQAASKSVPVGTVYTVLEIANGQQTGENVWKVINKRGFPNIRGLVNLNDPDNVARWRRLDYNF